jgi:outer membrane receptor protein involved in Fe transport
VALASANFQRNAYAAFADDTWKVIPKLTLSLGLRYELTGDSDDADQSFRFDADQIGAKRRRTLSV